MPKHLLTNEKRHLAGSGLIELFRLVSRKGIDESKMKKRTRFITQPTRSNMNPNRTNFNPGSKMSSRMDSLVILGMARRKIKQRATK